MARRWVYEGLVWFIFGVLGTLLIERVALATGVLIMFGCLLSSSLIVGAFRKGAEE